MLQRRRWERHRIELDVIARGDGVEVECRTSDICEGGLGLVTPHALAAGSELRFEIAAALRSPLAGIVRWCTASANGQFIVGVELVDVSERQLEELRAAIDVSAS